MSTCWVTYSYYNYDISPLVSTSTSFYINLSLIIGASYPPKMGKEKEGKIWRGVKYGAFCFRRSTDQDWLKEKASSAQGSLYTQATLTSSVRDSALNMDCKYHSFYGKWSSLPAAQIIGSGLTHMFFPRILISFAPCRVNYEPKSFTCHLLLSLFSTLSWFIRLVHFPSYLKVPPMYHIWKWFSHRFSEPQGRISI
jgi:hypothetical protein